MKRKEHRIDPEDIELNDFEFRMVMGASRDHLKLFTENILCTCSAPSKILINYKPYFTKLNDIVMNGKCGGCKAIAARYIETGENRENYQVAERIRKIKKSSG